MQDEPDPSPSGRNVLYFLVADGLPGIRRISRGKRSLTHSSKNLIARNLVAGPNSGGAAVGREELKEAVETIGRVKPINAMAV